ncbi:glucosamine-6-phosphate deaminase (plasmid) [Curtobacterium sp. MCLR17_007]|uniref:glucosamine-6-phosphate deaminase n=1 Tax=Curtobacterium sp. MCLR17_007 TaxID=2175648 RepID=UPI0021ACBEEE|nr:glucosamine-6-phosphate deaminase [Curtobacterium sp. MCLR17_007]WIB62118.1 glucosamine-6-phosphate deaminase [Curtobacterium sp. MCLR17_007]
MSATVHVAETAEAAGAVAAEFVANRLAAPGSGRVLGVATGSSPQPLYRALSAAGIDLAGVTAFALDEYVGLPPEHPESYESVVRRDVTEPLGLDPARVHVPDGVRSDPDAGAVEYDRAIRAAGGIDVQVLGIGANGHIGFNEPGSESGSRTRVVALAESTRRANARFFASVADVPTNAVTQGIGTVLEARSIVLVATGADKAEAVRAALEGPVTRTCPASFLQRAADVLFCLDREAAGRLSRFGAASI